MKSKLLFTAALMSAASLASQETYEAKGVVAGQGAYEYAMHAPLPGFVTFQKDEDDLDGKALDNKYNNGKANNYHAFALSASTNALGGE